MDKKDIYEHLAKIYLDASTRKNKKLKKPSGLRYLFFISIIFALVSGIILSRYLPGNKRPDTQIALILQNDVAKINFTFNPAKKEIYDINLNKLDLGRFNTLAFSLKKSNYRDSISVRVELTNTFREKSGIYLKDIPARWHDYKISFRDFRGISDWSQITRISFIVEEWNAREKHGIVYIDNIRLLR
ncbi:MAG: hypothetical protein PHF11_05315 [Candidatus Omnitrophica bacterium]|nr:hypothetical protein [Candidatus Omnitrophota bacterium]